jgi:hypothetical protein
MSDIKVKFLEEAAGVKSFTRLACAVVMSSGVSMSAAMAGSGLWAFLTEPVKDFKDLVTLATAVTTLFSATVLTAGGLKIANNATTGGNNVSNPGPSQIAP